jgi:hypothetical protein
MNDRAAAGSPFYALGPKNELMPIGRALSLWGGFAEKEMVAVDGADAFATRSEDGTRMTVWILNRTFSWRDVSLRIEGGNSFAQGRCHRFWGQSDRDRNPRWEQLPDIRLRKNIYKDSVPPLSVTVLTLRAAAK